MTVPRLAVICDLVEEDWPSMALVAEMLLEQLRAARPQTFDAGRVCPPLVRRFTRPAALANQRHAFNADRLVNRFVDYPRMVRRQRKDFDYFHVCDHSYAQLVHSLPRGRTGVFCHDLDTFRSILEPAVEPRSYWFRAMARHILAGLQKADVVFHSTDAVRAQIVRHGLLDERRLVRVRYGISSDFSPRTDPGGVAAMPPLLREAPFVLHVGSCIARKRVDVALEAFASVRARRPELRFVQLGGEWSSSQDALISRLGIRESVVQLRRQERYTVAELYRRAALVVMPSEAEGFGLPVVEALACGSPVLASDIPVFREVAGEAVVFAKVADVASWAGAIEKLLASPESAPPLSTRIEHASQFSWEAHATTIAAAYARL